LTAYFDKYRFPPTIPEDVIKVLTLFGFKRCHVDDGTNDYYQQGERRVPVPREKNLAGITILDIISQSAINEDVFLEVLNRVRRARIGIAAPHQLLDKPDVASAVEKGSTLEAKDKGIV
jgi:hypothetical protein